MYSGIHGFVLQNGPTRDVLQEYMGSSYKTDQPGKTSGIMGSSYKTDQPVDLQEYMGSSYKTDQPGIQEYMGSSYKTDQPMSGIHEVLQNGLVGPFCKTNPCIPEVVPGWSVL